MMMKVGSMNGASFQGAGGGAQAGSVSLQNDSVSKNIQNQIANAQKQLQEISANQEMTLEEKMKKRQEIQQEITNLNQQLRQHQIEQRKERQSKSSSMDDMIGGKQNTGKAGNGLSQASMQAMISADSSMKQAQVQGNVATRMEGRAGVLKAEIKQDAGGNTEAKEAELAEAEQKAMSAAASQMNTLANANQTMEEAAKADQDSRMDETGAKAENKADETNHNGQEIGEVSVDEADGTGSQAAVQPQETGAAVELLTENAAVQTNPCRHVDIRL